MNRPKKAALAVCATLLLGVLIGTGLWASGGWDWQAVERTGWLASIGAFTLPITGVWVWALKQTTPTPPQDQVASEVPDAPDHTANTMNGDVHGGTVTQGNSVHVDRSSYRGNHNDFRGSSFNGPFINEHRSSETNRTTTQDVTALENLLADHLRFLGREHPETLKTRSKLAHTLGETGNPAKAVQAYADLLTDQIRLFGTDDPITLSTQVSLANWRGEAGNPVGAVVSLEEALSRMFYIFGENQPDVLRARADLARWTYASGNITQAIELLTAVNTDRRRVLGPDHPDTHSGEQVLQNWQSEHGDN